MERKFSKRGFARRIVFLINAVAALFLLLSQIAASVSPALFWPAELIAIAYPFLLILNSGFIIYWLLMQSRFVWVSLLVVLSGFNHLQQFYQLKFGKTADEENAFSVMSYNVRLFDLYNWTGNLKTRAKIFYQLREQKPDIICFQEFYNSDEGDFKNTDTLLKILHGYKAHVGYGITLRRVDHWGLATFTRFPIVGKGRVIYEEGKTNFGLYTDVKIYDDTVRIYNVHLQSNHFKADDYRFIEAPDSGSNEQILSASKSILRRLKNGAIKRAQQVDELKLHIDSSPYRVIVCGDFNDPPFSYAYSRLSRGLEDTFIEKGKGTGATYIGKVPFYRIDFILHNDSTECLTHDVVNSKWSDHFPIVAKLRL